ncbi:MAG: hypothetical protein JXA41_01825 [Deltaproteobacteria bacterium]|nr:hypothetical protein [Deltaproteobacteria bacterium]
MVPREPVRNIAEKLFTDLEYHLLEDDHPLSRSFKTLDWDNLLKEI